MKQHLVHRFFEAYEVARVHPPVRPPLYEKCVCVRGNMEGSLCAGLLPAGLASTAWTSQARLLPALSCPLPRILILSWQGHLVHLCDVEATCAPVACYVLLTMCLMYCGGPSVVTCPLWFDVMHTPVACCVFTHYVSGLMR